MRCVSVATGTGRYLRNGRRYLADLQHELDSLQRRQAAWEDALLECWERRGELQAQQTAESRAPKRCGPNLGCRPQADEASAEMTASATFIATRCF